MTDDLISKRAAIEIIQSMYPGMPRVPWMLKNWKNQYEPYIRLEEEIKGLPSAQSEPRWIPIKTRPMDEEERAHYEEVFDWQLDDEDAVMFDCPMPEDGQEVWVCSKCGNVWQDTCVVDEGIGLEGNGDWLDIVAWMPFTKPKPWKGADNGLN